MVQNGLNCSKDRKGAKYTMHNAKHRLLNFCHGSRGNKKITRHIERERERAVEIKQENS